MSESPLAVAVRGRGVVDPGEPVIHADDLGFLRGLAAFETIRVVGGRPFDLEHHLDRLEASAARLGLPSVGRDELIELTTGALAAAAVADCVLRIIWSAGRDGAHEATVIAVASRLPPGLEALRLRGLRLVSLQLGVDPRAVAGARWLLGGVKSTSYAVNVAAVREAARRGADDALFVASDGTVLEGTMSNIWWRDGSLLRTPSLELGILAGVTRIRVLELAAGLGYRTEEGAWTIEQPTAAAELFTSSSIRGVMPVVELDGRPIGDGRPGEAAAALGGALRRVAEG